MTGDICGDATTKSVFMSYIEMKNLEFNTGNYGAAK
jgi:hypothetical protein